MNMLCWVMCDSSCQRWWMVECRNNKNLWWRETQGFDHIDVHHIVDAHKEVLNVCLSKVKNNDKLWEMTLPKLCH